MSRIKRFLVGILFMLSAGQFPSLGISQTVPNSLQLAQSTIVRQILIKGTQRIEPDTVKAFVGVVVFIPTLLFDASVAKSSKLSSAIT